MLLLVRRSCFQLYPIRKGTLLSSILAVILARVLVRSLERGADDVLLNQLLSLFIRIFAEVLILCHATVQGICELVENDIDPCPIRYFGLGVL